METAIFYIPILFLLCHFVGDFILQSDWMAMNKSRKSIPCLVHVLIYTACFLVLTVSWKALLFIGLTHFMLDRFHTPLKRLLWLKNHIGPTMEYPPYGYCNSTGYYDDSPYNSLIPDKEDLEKWGKPRHFFITIWIYITIDNTLHLICNLIALSLLA